MKHNSTKLALRWFFRLEIACLCLTLLLVGSGIAADRTAFTAQGAPAAAQTDTPVRAALSRLPDKPALTALEAYAPLLPAPAGNLFAVILSFRNFAENSLPETFSRLHNFFR